MNTTRPWVIDDQPSRRFPVYTRGNTGEVFPNVMTPMTGSLLGEASTDGQIRAMRELGLVTARDLAEPGAVGTGVFGGYLYGNLSLMRVACDRAPGMTALDADRQYAGLGADAPAHRRQPGDRNLATSLRGIRVMGRNMLWPDISEVDAARVTTDRWRSSIGAPEGMSDQHLVEFVRSYPPRFADGMRLLLLYSGLAAAGGAMMEQFAERTESPAGTTATLTAGLGTIDSAVPAFRLWSLGRRVAASPTLMQFFDDERADLDEIAGHPDVEDFRDALESFLETYGARGPDEWEFASPTWGTNPEIVLAAIERLRHAPEERDPVAASRRLAAERDRVRYEARDRAGRPTGPRGRRARGIHHPLAGAR